MYGRILGNALGYVEIMEVLIGEYVRGLGFRGTVYRDYFEKCLHDSQESIPDDARVGASKAQTSPPNDRRDRALVAERESSRVCRFQVSPGDLF